MIATAAPRRKPYPHPLDLDRPIVGTLTIDRLLFDNRDYLLCGRVDDHRFIVRVPATSMTTFAATARALVREGIIVTAFAPRSMWGDPSPALTHSDEWLSTLAAAAREAA